MEKNYMQLKVSKHYVTKLCKAILEDVKKEQEMQMDELVKQQMGRWLFPVKTREEAEAAVKADKWFVPKLYGAQTKAEDILNGIDLAENSGLHVYEVKLNGNELAWLKSWADALKFDKPIPFPPDSPGEGGGDGP
jgi:hypothetical protein